MNQSQYDNALAAKASLKKWIYVLPVFIAIIPTHLLYQNSVIPPGVEFLGSLIQVQKEKDNFVVTSSVKCKITCRQFHVEVVQKRQRNVQKSMIHTKLLFYFSRSHLLSSRCWIIKSLVWPENTIAVIILARGFKVERSYQMSEVLSFCNRETA